MSLKDRKQELLLAIEQKQLEQRATDLRVFVPEVLDAEPFEAQLAYLNDVHNVRLLRCGNRAAKTFTSMRDLAYRITRTHPWQQKWNVLDIKNPEWNTFLDTDLWETKYYRTKPKVFWIVGTTYEFVNGVMFGQYLSKMIPSWFIEDIKYTNQKNIDRIIFRNGDTLSCKTYSQQDTAKMGFSVDDIRLDEMPPDPMSIRELIMRTLDKNGDMTMAFTPLVENEEIRVYLDTGCEKGTVSLHSWSLVHNPLYRDNPALLARAMAEFENMPENERMARVHGHWYYETPLASVFSGLMPEIVEDFDIPLSWRQVRFTDPAAHVTGHAIFAEDPETGVWYCTTGVEFSFGKIAKAETIITEIERLKPQENFHYYMSKYDNAEAWFGAYAAACGYTPNIMKNRERAIMDTRNAVANGRLKFFRRGAHEAVIQMRNYHYNKDGDKIVKKKDHILDCVMYFCREIPPPPVGVGVVKTFKQELMEQHMAMLDKQAADRNKPMNMLNPYKRMYQQSNSFRRQVR